MNSICAGPWCAVALAALGAPAWSQTTTRVSVDPSGAQVLDGSSSAALSANGGFVAFVSYSNALVWGDTNGASDTFVRDRRIRTTQRANLTSSGAQTHAGANASLSADGRFVAFTSDAVDVVPGDLNGWDDAFVRDRVAGTTELVSVSSSGAQGNFPSSMWSAPSISADGRYVAFASAASNLVAGDTNGFADVFVHDRQTHVTQRVDVSSAGAQSNDDIGYLARVALSADGRYVAFESWASNLVAGDTNAKCDVFVRDLVGATTTRVSVGAALAQANNNSFSVALSGTGRWVAFMSVATNLVAGDVNGVNDAFVHDRQTGVTERVSVRSTGAEANLQCNGYPTLSADGRFVAFESLANNLVAQDTNADWDVFLRDRQTATTTRISVNSFGAQAHGASRSPAISGNGRFIAFESTASDLVAHDTNARSDVFVHDRLPCSNEVVAYCAAKVNSLGCTPSIVSSGTPSSTAGSGFVIGAAQVLELQSGVLFYGVHGANDVAFQGGRMCVRSPLKRTAVQTAGSGGALPCVGTYSFDFNAHIAVGGDAALAIGTQVWAQFWTRDPSAVSTTGLTDALSFVICE